MSLVREAFARRPAAVAVVLTWTQPYFRDDDVVREVKAWTVPTHFEAGILAGLHPHSRIFTR